MDRYRVAPSRPVTCRPGGHLRPGGGAEIGIFTAERYFNAADVVRRHDAVLRPALPDHHHHHEPPPSRLSVAASDAASCQSGRTAASSEASWNSRSGLLSAAHHHTVTASSRLKGGGGGAVVNNASGGERYSGGGNNKKRWTLFRRGDCPCAGRKAVVTVAAASSEPRSPAFDARFSAQSAVDECLESAIFKAKQPPSPSRPPPPQPRDHEEEEPAKMKVVTVTPGSRAFPVAAAVPSEAFAAAIGRRAVGRGFTTFPAAVLDASSARFTSGGGGVLEDEPPRASLEVFRPIDEDSVMFADPLPPAMPTMASTRGRDLVLQRAPQVVAVAEEEAMSDASSDLFDLESFAASSSYPTTYRGGRNSGDDYDDLPYAAEPALSECGMYAPSEASVVWSVATAEGGGAFDAASAANFSSAASACGGTGEEDFRFAVGRSESPEQFAAAVSRGGAGRKKGGGGGGLLNSCRCEKAVSVGPTPVRMDRPPAYPAKKGSSGSAERRHPGRVHVPVRT